MKKLLKNILLFSFVSFTLLLSFSCKEKEKGAFKIVFYPNESGESMKDARSAFKDILQKALEREVEIVTTTDYNIALETLISGKANMAYVGAEGYIQAHNKNKAVIPLVTNSGASGTLSDSLYYAFIACLEKNEGKFEDENGVFNAERLLGKRISFVSVNSTSGFTLPAKFLQSALKVKDTDELVKEGGCFSKVIFASSHQGSQVMLYKDEADLACFAIPQTIKVYALVSGEENSDGAVYEVQKTDDKPFSDYVGEKIKILKAIPVLNAPLVINRDTVSNDEIRKIKVALTSDETANNPGIFKMTGHNVKGIFPKWTEKTRLIEVDDTWYDKLRNIQ
ncbi:MAG: phosphate/phosphite/phosphonate ABC transporter substrate-binding protein [Treponema sp.]